jgi:hypothetical protein
MDRANSETVTTPSDRVIVITRSFDAPRSLVFEAGTKAERVALLKIRVDVGTTRTLDNLDEYLGLIG